MKLTEEHIDKGVQYCYEDDRTFCGCVVAVTELNVCLLFGSDQGLELKVFPNDNFQLFPFPGKRVSKLRPSERIRELIKKNNSELTNTSLRAVHAIIEFLDEQDEKNK